MADAKKQDRWLDVKDAMPARSLVLGPQVSTALSDDPEGLILALSFYKLAAKLIGPGKRAVVAGCGEGIGAWVLAKECGFALGLEADAAALASARSNFTDERTAFEPWTGAFPAGPWQAIVHRTKDAVAPPALIEQAAAALSHDGLLILGSEEGSLSAEPRAWLERQFHHVFVFSESLGIVPIRERGALQVTAAVGCRPRSVSS